MTPQERIDHIRANKSDIVKLRKMAVKYSDGFGANIFEKNFCKDFALKADNSTSTDTDEVITRTIVPNTYKWMDSHDDVHIPGVFTKTIQENQSNIFHLHDHLYQTTAKVGVPKLIYEKEIPWSTLGVPLAGNTTVLLADSEIIKSFNPQIFDQYSKGQITQHSVGMMYVNMFLCINDPLDKEHYANWQQYSIGIGNIDKVLAQGYFWAITEAKLKEFSCVLSGSNELTPVLENKQEPSTDTQEIEPTTVTQKRRRIL